MKFNITALHQIEMTSECNLRCKYCVHPKMLRKKMHMEEDVYMKSLQWAKFFVAKYGQKELNLAGIGESTLHPDFTRFVGLAREAIGYGKCQLILATNGIEFSKKHGEDMVKEIAKYDPWIWVSAHRPEKAGPAIELLKKYNLLKGVSADPSIAAIDWAGQVDWFTSHAPMSCTWLPAGKVFVGSNGDLMPCCLDGNGSGKFGNIMEDDLLSLKTGMYDLCNTCSIKIVLRGANGGTEYANQR